MFQIGHFHCRAYLGIYMAMDLFSLYILFSHFRLVHPRVNVSTIAPTTPEELTEEQARILFGNLPKGGEIAKQNTFLLIFKVVLKPVR